LSFEIAKICTKPDVGKGEGAGKLQLLDVDRTRKREGKNCLDLRMTNPP